MKPRSKRHPESEEFSPAFRRELLRRIREADDPRRYLLASVFTPKFVLYYIVEDNVYILRNAEKATAFKSRRAAEAVRKTLGKHIALIPAKRRKDGTLHVSRKAIRAAARFARRRTSSKRRSRRAT